MSPKGKKGRKKKPTSNPATKIFFLLILAGIAALLFFHFREEITGMLKPRVKEPSVPAKKKTVIVYFSDEEEEYLIGEKREILEKATVAEEAKALILELTRGPRGKLIPTLPPHTKLLTLDLDEKGVAKVNFDKTLVKGHPGGSSAEIMTVYSVVNSLTLNFPEIKRVQILVEGNAIRTITGHLALTEPVTPNRSLIKVRR